MAKAYVIITEDVKDQAGMGEYAKLAGKTMGCLLYHLTLPTTSRV